MTAPGARPAGPGARRELPLLFRLTAGGRRVLCRTGTKLVYRSVLAEPLRRTLTRIAPAELQIVDVCGGPLRGARMYVDLSCEKYYWLGTHEEAVQRLLAERVRRGFVVYDVGAHAGFFTLLCSRLAGDEGRVYAFEPRPENVERLKANIDANRAQNARVQPVALSDSTGEAAFVMDGSTLEGRLAEPGYVSSAQVRTETIDALVRDEMAPPDLIKIDVEGAEGAVIRGATRTIDTYRPLLVIEVHSERAGAEVSEALPCRYVFREVEGGESAAEPLRPGRYFGEPVVGPGRPD